MTRQKSGASASARKDAHDPEPPQGPDASAVTRALLDWYRRAKRDLPWRRTSDAYAIWLSEMMLQQTRVETVVPYYGRFLQRFPTVMALAEAPLEDVLAEWSGLGYYRRARMLHAAAQAVVAEHGGAFPRTATALQSLPGIGRYTAGAVASIAWGERAALVDGNVARVLSRTHAIFDDPTRGAGNASVWRIADSLVPANAPGDFNQALMELGATVCTPRAPRCDACPLSSLCEARARGLTAELPRIAAKAAPERVALVALVARNRAGVLLARRAEGGLFAGLWEPPSVPGQVDDDDILVKLRWLLGKAPKAVASCGAIVHVLSHRRLEVGVVAGPLPAGGSRALTLRDTSVYDALRIVSDAEIDALPRSALAQRILRCADGAVG